MYVLLYISAQTVNGYYSELIIFGLSEKLELTLDVALSVQKEKGFQCYSQFYMNTVKKG